MALDKLVDSTQLDGALTATANALRTKGGTSAQIAWDATNGFKAAVEALPSGTAAISVVDTTDTHGGTIREITALDISDTTAVAADVASGKYFYTAQGVKTAGTASGGSGGLVYETGTYTPVSDVNRPTINYINTHDSIPFFVMILDTSETTPETNSALYWLIANWYTFSGKILKNGNFTYYARSQFAVKASSNITSTGINIDRPTQSNPTSSSLDYYLTTSNFTPDLANSTRYFKSGVTYKWIAVWAPTT